MGLGAYVSGTVLLTAALRGLPTLILEPNAEPGLANKWLGPFIDEAALAWEETSRHFGAKSIVTGNPVRQSIVDVPPLTEQTQGPVMRVLLFGGSQGSTILNRAMTGSLPLLADVSERLHIVHQTGPSDFESVRKAYEEHSVNGHATPYIDAMDEAYAQSDLVVSRAGATTCAELAASGRPAVLVPLPLAGGHQEANAAMLERAGAARTIRQSGLTPERLTEELVSLLEAPGQRLAMAANARSLARPDAAARVAERLVALSKGASS
jgi:UDP-N-acetylglucosamine--N-acetylmuramyl-(pentapeptide) pyrophosphoryl-undecaprenol N-acetylglucosamine transferase